MDEERTIRRGEHLGNFCFPLIRVQATVPLYLDIRRPGHLRIAVVVVALDAVFGGDHVGVESAAPWHVDLGATKEVVAELQTAVEVVNAHGDSFAGVMEADVDRFVPCLGPYLRVPTTSARRGVG